MLVEKIIKIEGEEVYLAGGIYDDITTIISEIEKQNLCNCHLFFLGNLNIKSTADLDDKFLPLYHILKKYNICSYIIRGSNDEPSIWNNKFECELRDHSLMRFVDERTRLYINDNKGLIVPAVSDDDKPKLPSDIKDFGENRKNVDFVFGHGGPVLADFFKQDLELSEKYLKYGLFKDNFKANQDEYKKILHRYRPKRWYCSHYLIDKQTKFVWDNWSDDGIISLKMLAPCSLLRIA